MREKFKVFISKFKQNFQKKNFLMMMAVVLFIVVSVSIPVHQAQAWNPLGDAVKWGIEAALSGLAAGGTFLLNLLFAVLVAVLNIGLDLSIFLVRFGAWLIDAMLDPRLYVGDPAAVPPVPGVLTSTTVTVGWTTVRDMCNTFYVFFLLIIAFGTILRSSTFNAKNLLPKLVISLFLINFSAVIAKMVIDLGQVLMYGIMAWMGNFQDGGGSLTSIVDKFKNEIDGAGWQANFDQVVKVAFALAYSVILGLTYVMLALFLLVRLVAFVLLIILSPIAFLSIVMPSMGKYTSEWWSELVKYSIFGPIFMFFVYLSATMANELVTNFTPLPPAANNDISIITGIVYVMVPHAVGLMMLLAVVPITQRLGVSGANKIIGGHLGLGNIVMGGYSGAKKTFGFGKAVAGAPASRIHAGLKGWSPGYNKLSEKTGNAIKKLPVVGKIYLEGLSEDANKREENVKKYEKKMDTMTDKDKKIYADSFIDPNAKAAAQQALFNHLAKDNGKGLSNERLQKMGYAKDKIVNGKVVMEDEKDKNGKVIGQKSVKEFDKDSFMSDYGRAVAHGMDTANIEKYRPDLIKDESDRIDKVKKIALDGDEKKIKLDVLADEKLAEVLEKAIGTKKYEALIDNKTQEERTGLANIKEDQIVKGIHIFKTSGAGAKGAIDNTSDAGKELILKKQKEIADLTGADKLEDKMHDIIDLDVNQEIVRHADINLDLAQKVIGDMSKDRVLNLDKGFLGKYGYMLSKSNGGHIAKFGEDSQSEAIKESIKNALAQENMGTWNKYVAEYQTAHKGATPKAVNIPLNIDNEELKQKLKEIEKKI